MKQERTHTKTSSSSATHLEQKLGYFLQLLQSRLWRLVSSPGSLNKKQRRRGGSAPPCRNLAWDARFHLCGTGTELSKGNQEEFRNWVFVMNGGSYPPAVAGETATSSSSERPYMSSESRSEKRRWKLIRMHARKPDRVPSYHCL